MVFKKVSHFGLKAFILPSLWVICFVVISLPVPAQGFAISYGDIELGVSPGERITARFSVSNQSEETIVLRIYCGDWIRVQGEITRYEFDIERGNEVRSFLEWMTFSPDQMELGPNEMQEVISEVNFPDDPSLEGSYWGVVFVEEIPQVAPPGEIPEDEAFQVGILTIFRYAVKIYATFEGTEIRDASFLDLLIDQVEGGFDINAAFENSGNIFMRPEVWLEIRDTAGDVVYQQTHIRQTVLPESTREYVFELRDLSLEPGTYLVMVIADYDGPSLVGAQGTMLLSAEQTGPDDQ